MIIIGKPQIKIQSGKARLSALIQISESAYQVWISRISNIERYTGYEKMYQHQSGEFELWYETDEKEAKGFCTERNDAFVLAVLYFAMISGEDIYSQAPVSNELLHSLNTYLIPLHCNERSGYKAVHVIGETLAEPLETQGENGTGISCGVDSFETTFQFLEKDMDPAHRLTCLCLFNAGAFHYMPEMQECIAGNMTIQEWDERAHQQFLSVCERGREVAAELGLRFLAVDTNISDLYQGVFLQSHVFRNCSVVLALEKLFGHYYYASAGEPGREWRGLEKDATDNVWFFSTETVRLYIGSREKTRIEKLKYLSNHELVKKYLHVCCKEEYNCGRCGKCFRTLLILDLLGKLEEFAPAFEDVEFYRKKKWKKYVWLLDKEKEDQFAADILEYMKEKNIHIPAVARIYHFTFPIRKVIKKVIKK